MAYSTKVKYQINASISNTLDLITSPDIGVAYWEENGTLRTSHRYLTRLNNLGVYPPINIDEILTSAVGLLSNGNLTVDNFEFSDTETFVDELITIEPLWAGIQTFAVNDPQLAYFVELCVTFLIAAKDNSTNVSYYQRLKENWFNMLARLSFLIGGNLATGEQEVSWNERVYRLAVPTWLLLGQDNPPEIT